MGWGWELHGWGVLILTEVYLMENSAKINQKEIIGKLVIFLSESYSIGRRHLLLHLYHLEREGKKTLKKKQFIYIKISGKSTREN